ncbi:MAG: methionyl-tRNA formyltransferase [Pseudomonadota bacterium]
MGLSLIFMGTPDFSVPALRAILDSGHDVVAVYSQPPRRAGRGMKERPSPVHKAARDAGLPVFTPTSLRDETIQGEFTKHEADVAVVVAYGLLLPQAVLDTPDHGCLNIHASLLPRWRGAAPINRAIMAGDSVTGVTIMKMEAGLDTGPMAISREIPICPDETAGHLHDRLSELGADLIVEALAALEADGLSFREQPQEGVTYASKIDKAETAIDWNRGAEVVHRHIRGLSPFPGAWCLMPFGGRPERVKILDAVLAPTAGASGTVMDEDLTIACGDGGVRPTRLQRAGKQPLDRVDFLRGQSVPAGTVMVEPA